MRATENHLTSAAVLELRGQLEDDRNQVLTEYLEDLQREREIPIDETGDLVDRAEAAAGREELFAAAVGEQDRLREIDEALLRMRDGTYGRCLAGGEPIPVVRLRAIPSARHCAAHQEELEAAAVS